MLRRLLRRQRPAQAALCGKRAPGATGIPGTCGRPAGHGGFCYAGTDRPFLRLLVEAENRYPADLDSQRAFLRASVTPGARV